MTIREEFEEALEKYLAPIETFSPQQVALWTAKWMAERCSEEVHSHWNDSMTMTNQREQAFRSGNVLRKLAKELE